jgi:hypothetical protein
LNREGVRSTSESGAQTINPFEVTYSEVGTQTTQSIVDQGINTLAENFNTISTASIIPPVDSQFYSQGISIPNNFLDIGHLQIINNDVSVIDLYNSGNLHRFMSPA